MNDQRRKAIASVVSQLEDLQHEIDSLKEEEETYRDNMPDSFQSSERYEKAEEAIDNLDTASTSVREAIETLQQIE